MFFLIKMDSFLTEQTLASLLGQALLAKKWRCGVAESCTGGRLAGAITEIAGSSQWFDRGFITYSNESKREMLDVSRSVLETCGAVSQEVVCAMAAGVLSKSQAEISVAISGVAGPGGGSLDKPVGLVWLAWVSRLQHCESLSFHFKGDRSAIRSQAVCAALEGLIARCQ